MCIGLHVKYPLFMSDFDYKIVSICSFADMPKVQPRNYFIKHFFLSHTFMHLILFWQPIHTALIFKFKVKSLNWRNIP